VTVAAAVADDLAVALALADRADELTMAAFTGAPLAHVAKADGSPVTETDRLVEDVLRELLHERRPDDAVVGEEQGRTGPAGAVRRWILDPVDGTASFIAGGRGWATQIALEGPNGVLVGVTSAPAASARWWGVVGGEARSRRGRRAPEERPLRVTPIADLASARWVAHVEATEEGGAAGRARAARLGAAAGEEVAPTSHGALMVAAGEVDVCLVSDGAAWDHAAFAAIVVAAGGRFSTLDGGTVLGEGYYPALYSNGSVHDAALAAVTATTSDP
jgi:histidinol-phosphatase